MTRDSVGRGRRRAKAAVSRERTPYEVLAVAETATAEEIRRAYLAKVREFPPEREPEGFKEVQKAYTILRDAARRKVHDLSVFRRTLDPERPPEPAVDCAALFRERIFLLLLASSELYAKDFSRFSADIDPEVEALP